MWKETICYRICGAEAKAEQHLQQEGDQSYTEEQRLHWSREGAGLQRVQQTEEHIPLESRTQSSIGSMDAVVTYQLPQRWGLTSNEEGQIGLEKAVGHWWAVVHPVLAHCSASSQEATHPFCLQVEHGKRRTEGAFQAGPNRTFLPRSYKSCS